MEARTTSTRVYLVRHGITDWIEQGILQGISDRPLSSLGLEQAELTARAFRGATAAHLFSSPLLRAGQTAQPIAREIGVATETIDDFKEMDYGWLEGKEDYWPKVKQNKLLIQLYHATLRLSGYASGESPKKFQSRVLKAWETIRTSASKKPLIIVAHFNVLRNILIREFGANNDHAMNFSLSACSISEIEINGNSPSRIIRLNDVSHLNGKVQD